ncbi:carboxy terminal-processing peptidase [Hymenobacter chitinivorans]|uniref:Carboxyl-terminal processing protease n=1 Tax=Hymenobacter chitinivorans DSM 11115 TaxID=1121954 RepID=A0A2M9BM69_9BACT|nr:carboxy terminal-processing peptidase [Hymenobacter chitinivorans]PJJ59056.1 carboxyl-terminal processing protease [Hymenobacter chitinivorans DSM 11115]
MASFRSSLGFSALLPGFLLLFPTGGFTQRPADGVPPQKKEVLLGTIAQGLGVGHVQPEQIDNEFSRRVYALYLKHLDGSKRFLLQPDVKQLQRYETGIDDEIRQGKHEFLDLSTKLIDQRVQEAQVLYRELLQQPFEFSANETFETDPDKLTFPADAAARRDRWRRLLKYQTMQRVSELMDEQSRQQTKSLAATKAKPSDATLSAPVRTPAQLEADARKQVLKYYDEFFSDLRQTDEADRLAEFANTVANTFDPHSEYFAPKDKTNFDLALTGRLEGTGAQLGEKDGQIVVAYLVPGSASYRQGELKAGDVILRVGQGAAEPVAVEGLRMDKVVQMIRGKKGTEVRLTVKKPDASTKVISIIRDVVVLEETYAQSAVINDGGKKIGYILLPSFYADFNHNGGRNSADDVKAELQKLKKENVQGVVLDLRFNGGGSLQDAAEMAGLFVANGPMVQVKSRQGAADLVSDPDPKVQYDGPLAVLVNKYSASASEILAGAIQDYKRGVIVGNTTYGKGTVQRIFELDDIMNPALANLKPFGSLKMTVQKYYRITGSSTQFKGVTPDIPVPDAYSALADGEQDTDYPLKWDEITPAQFKPWAAAPNVEKLAAASRQRVAGSPSFRLLTDAVQGMVKRQKVTQVSLNLAAYRAEQQEAHAAAEKFKQTQQAAPTLEVAPLLAAATTTPADTTADSRATRFVKPLRKDLTLREAVAVIQDQL